MLTDKQVRALTTEKEREDVFDAEGGIPGFGVRVRQSGKKTFFLLYRAPSAAKARTRKLRRLRLGEYGPQTPAVTLATARQRARAALGDVAKGVDPSPAVTHAPETGRTPATGRLVEFLPTGFFPGSFGELAAEYLLNHAWQHKKDPLPDERALRRKLLPKWADISLTTVNRRTIIAYLDQLRRTSGPVAANRVQALLSKMFNFGLQRDLADYNPVAGITKNKETPRDKFLSEAELQLLFGHLGNSAAHTVLRLILLTGMRPGEVRRMKWDDLEEDRFNLPASSSKNGIATRVYLSGPARASLTTFRAERHESPYIFPGPVGKPIGSIRGAVLELREATGLKFTARDLRRTCATHLARLGYTEIVPEILNHKPRGVTSIYNRYRFDKEKKDALSAWAEELLRIEKFAQRPYWSEGQPWPAKSAHKEQGCATRLPGGGDDGHSGHIPRADPAG